MSRRWRYPRVRRGDFFDVPPAQVAAAAPELVPQFIRQSRRYGSLVRRGSLLEPPWPQQVPPPAFASTRHRVGLVARRGDYLWTPPSPVTVAGIGPWIQPPFRWPGRRGMLCRRTQYFEIPLVGLAPAAPTGLPQWITCRRQRIYPVRRRLPYSVPSTPLRPPPYQTPRRPCARPVRRGQFHEPPWPFTPPQPSVWRPDLVRARRRPIPRPRAMHCRYFEPGWPQAVTGGTFTRTDRAITSLLAASRDVSAFTAADRAAADIGAANRDMTTLTSAARATPTLTGG